MTPAELAKRYFACVRARDIDGWMALFAEDARYILPNGNLFEGAANIRAVQTSVFASGAPFPTPQQKLIDGKSMAVEVEAMLPDGSTRRTVNLYTLNDEGLIQQLSVFMQSGQGPQ
jgi:hypothetical protein